MNGNVTIRLQGGLGNQLFQYFAGYHVAQSTARTLKIDASFISDGITPREAEIQLFRLPGDFIGRVSRSKSISRRLFQGVLRRNQLTQLVAKRLGFYQSRTVGFDAGIVNRRTIRILEGYFQSYKHVEEGANELLPLELHNKSAELENWLNKLEESDPVALHVRRGDYVKVAEEVGILSPAYYSCAIANVRKERDSGEIWIFSDDNEYAAEVAEELGVSVVFPRLDTAAEEMYLMIRCPRIIISNSTFSWWAAYSREHEAVICPDKWFKGMEDPESIIPPNWKRIQSKWVPN